MKNIGTSASHPDDLVAQAVMDHRYSVLSRNINNMTGHSPSDSQLHEMENPDSNRPTSSFSTMTDIILEYINSLELECQSQRNKCYQLEEQNDRLSLSEKSFEGSDEKVKYHTGLPTFHVLMHILNFVNEHLKQLSCLTAFQHLILTLMRIRLNLNVQDLAYRFKVSSSTVFRSFNHVFHVCSSHLVPSLVYWPDREHARNNLPMVIKNDFPRCIAIIDYFEIYTERPSDLKARNTTYSNYKSHNTMKYLIAISPLGFISYISKGWGGRVSDKYITDHCGMLEKIIPGDVILVDRGFDINGSLGLHGAEIIVPAFTKGKKQLSMIDVETTRNLAVVRIRVERAIGVARQKYTMLQSSVPVSLFQADVTTGLTTLDTMVHVACVLTNLSSPIAPSSLEFVTCCLPLSPLFQC